VRADVSALGRSSKARIFCPDVSDIAITTMCQSRLSVTMATRAIFAAFARFHATNATRAASAVRWNLVDATSPGRQRHARAGTAEEELNSFT